MSGSSVTASRCVSAEMYAHTAPWRECVKCNGLTVLFSVVLAGGSCSMAQSNHTSEIQLKWISSQDHSDDGGAPTSKYADQNKDFDRANLKTCNISILVEDNKKLGGFVLRQLSVELNRILSTGGANIHANLVTTGRAGYVLRVQDFPPKNYVEGDVLGQTAKEDPHYSFLFVETIENVWRQRGDLPRGGRAIVYARVYAHELAAHGILHWAHSRPEDKDMGFLGSGKNWGDFLFNNKDDTKFEFPPASGRLLNLRCRLANYAQGLGLPQPTHEIEGSTRMEHTLP